MQWFSYLDKREVFQQEYSQILIVPSPHFRWVVNIEDTYLASTNQNNRWISLNILIKYLYNISRELQINCPFQSACLRPLTTSTPTYWRTPSPWRPRRTCGTRAGRGVPRTLEDLLPGRTGRSGLSVSRLL